MGGRNLKAGPRAALQNGVSFVTLSLPPTPTPTESATAHISLLGEFALSAGGVPVPLNVSGQRLVAYLAVHGRGNPIPRTALCAALWTDAPPQRATARLRSLLWRLPQTGTAQVVSATSNTVALAAGAAVDLWDAEIEARSLMMLTDEPADALPPTSTFGSDLLPTWPEDWLVLEREAFRQVRLHALEASSESLLRAGEFTAALEAALAAVRCEPLRESAHRSVVAVHLAEGNHAEALRQYQSFRRLLSVELGLPPTQAIRSMVAPLLGRPLDGAGRSSRVAERTRQL